jgi:hypothetical protein
MTGRPTHEPPPLGRSHRGHLGARPTVIEAIAAGENRRLEEFVATNGLSGRWPPIGG